MEWVIDFSKHWIACWNAHDLDAVLLLYADDVWFSSPMVLRILPESGGTVRGKAALRRYWKAVLENDSDLHLQLVDVYSGVNTIALLYRTQEERMVFEVLTFHEGRVAVGHATHPVVSCPSTPDHPSRIQSESTSRSRARGQKLT